MLASKSSCWRGPPGRRLPASCPYCSCANWPDASSRTAPPAIPRRQTPILTTKHVPISQKSFDKAAKPGVFESFLTERCKRTPRSRDPIFHGLRHKKSLGSPLLSLPSSGKALNSGRGGGKNEPLSSCSNSPAVGKWSHCVSVPLGTMYP